MIPTRNTSELPINIAWKVSKCDPWTVPVLFLRSCSLFPETGETDGNGRFKGYNEVLIGVHWCVMSSFAIVHLLQLGNT